MQTLARDGLDTAQVTALLQADNIVVTAGLERLNVALDVVEDLSSELEGGSVTRSMYATVHGTCVLRIGKALAWGVDLVRPYMTLSDGVRSARFNVGVFSLATPKLAAGSTPPSYEVEGYDRVYLLQREVGDTWVAPAGAGVLAEVRRAVTASGLTGLLLDGSAEAQTLPTSLVWPLIPEQSGAVATWLRVVNDLLATVNYRGVWADQDGVLRSEPYRSPSEVAPEYVFDTLDPRTIVGEERTLTEDIWRAPNRWTFVQTNRAEGSAAPTVGDGIYVVTNQSDGLTSIDARGLTWNRYVGLEAASHASLVAKGDRIVRDDRRVSSTFEVRTGPFPAAGHFDVLTYRDDELAPDGVKVQATRWQLDLLGADQTWTWERVVL